MACFVPKYCHLIPQFENEWPDCDQIATQIHRQLSSRQIIGKNLRGRSYFSGFSWFWPECFKTVNLLKAEGSFAIF